MNSISGLAIQWGAVDSTGVYANLYGKDVAFGDTRPQPIASVLETLDIFLQQRECPVLSSYLVEKEEKRDSGAPGPMVGPDVDLLPKKVAHVIGMDKKVMNIYQCYNFYTCSVFIH